jgi:hypothetical protein
MPKIHSTAQNATQSLHAVNYRTDEAVASVKELPESDIADCSCRRRHDGDNRSQVDPVRIEPIQKEMAA